SGDYPHLLRLPIQSKTSATNLANLRRLNQKINERIREIRGKKIFSLPYADLWVITRILWLDSPSPPAYNPSHSEVVRNYLPDRKEGHRL
ncbi:MAG: hypothetical protein Q8L87_16870, partial [Anaerolineales bacterium]|nr:hypothetical protein [Anaerolineales bacterium]